MGKFSRLEDYQKTRLYGLRDMEVPEGVLFIRDEVEKLLSAVDFLPKDFDLYFFVSRTGKPLGLFVGRPEDIKDFEIPHRKSPERLSGWRAIAVKHSAKFISREEISFCVANRMDIGVFFFSHVPEAFWVVVPIQQGLVWGPYPVSELEKFPLTRLIGTIERNLSKGRPERPLAILVGLERWVEDEESMAELENLAKTAGYEVVDVIWQRRKRPDHAFFVGEGKAKEIAWAKQEKMADVVIFDGMLTPSQFRNLETVVGPRILDRSQLIIEIFSKRASTLEGKLQAEVARLKYELPRLYGKGAELSRLGGGIGVRGPGERYLEVQRRKILKRIRGLERRIEEIKRRRSEKRGLRERLGVPVIALVGYTNAGKSSVMRALTGANVKVEDKLFATLDTKVANLSLPHGGEILLVDTVGFIRRLPHELIAAFRATLEEVKYSDLLWVIVDSSSRQWERHLHVVMRTVAELGAGDKPSLLVFNKVDLIDEKKKERIRQKAQDYGKEMVFISAKTGEGLQDLVNKTVEILPVIKRPVVEVLVPYSEGKTYALLHERGQILDLRQDSKGFRIKAVIPWEVYGEIKRFLVEEE